MKKRFLTLILTLALLLSLPSVSALAKTTSSAKADTVFFYALNAEGKSVLLKTLSLTELKTISHGQKNGENYYISSTDNYPTTQYCEGVGFTPQELLDHVKSVTTVSGASALSFSGADTLRFMATDSYGSYSRAWTAAELGGVNRYYFPGLYDAWNTGWEVAGEESSKKGITLEEYNASYRASDPNYEAKRAVFDGGVLMPVVLMTESFSGRTTSETLVASSEPGIAGYVSRNGGVTGCLKAALTDETALRLALPMTEADLMAAHRTAYDNFKWIYNMRLDMASAPALRSAGTVAAAAVSFRQSGDTLTVTLTSDTPGARIYYGFDGAPQTLYTGPFTIDISGRELDSDPITLYTTAVREGWDDAGIQSHKYPGEAPAFRTVYSAMLGETLKLSPAESVSADEWQSWTAKLNFITIYAPNSKGYVTLDSKSYTVGADGISFDGKLFAAPGSYSFVFHATKYANKSVSVTMKAPAPSVAETVSTPFGRDVTLEFDSTTYQSGLSIYITPENGGRVMIPAKYLDRTKPGCVTLRADYFTAPGTAAEEPGSCTLELVNNSFSPASRSIALRLTAAFDDVTEKDWFYTYVTELAERGVVSGMTATTFVPSGTLTNGQAMKLLYCGLSGEIEPTGAHWASGYMDRAAADGLLPAGTEPDGAISRLVFCQAAAVAIGASTQLKTSPFDDCSDSAVLALYERGVISGVSDSSFDSDAILTRAQISKIIWCILNLEGTV